MGAVDVWAEDFAQLQLQLVDRTQWRYEVIRPMVLFADRTPQQRAHETHLHPATVRKLTRRFRQQVAKCGRATQVLGRRAERLNGAVLA